MCYDREKRRAKRNGLFGIFSVLINCADRKKMEKRYSLDFFHFVEDEVQCFGGRAEREAKI